MKIDSKLRLLGTSMPLYSDEDVKNEPMLFNCDLSTAMKRGGPLTRKFLDLLPMGWHDVPLVIDTRVHMLMEGWYPCIPGWHHDDVPRIDGGQPDYDAPLRSQHCMALVNGELAPTEFAIGEGRFDPVPPGKTVYKQWNEEVELKLYKRDLIKMSVPKRLVLYDDRTWHRGTPAVKRGWRWFGRASRYYVDGMYVARPGDRSNEVRRQVQVYLPAVNAGW